MIRSVQNLPKSQRYELALRRNLAAELSDDCEICPKCGVRYVIPGTKAWKMGVCMTCWNRALHAAIAAADAEEAARNEYDLARQRSRRDKLQRGKK